MSESLTKIKYLLPKYTRGCVIQVGGDGLAYPHFRDGNLKASLELQDIDAVFAPDGTDLDRCGDRIKDGGYLIAAMGEDFMQQLETTGQDWTIERVEVAAETLFVFARKGTWPQPVKPVKTACVVRFGGFGDMLQTALTFPALKAQGYHVTVMTTPRGQDVLANDPNVDAWHILDSDQVPNEELPEFWRIQAKEFDRFINLSESIEGTLLALPGRTNHGWPYEVRKKRLNLNYHEWTAELAGVPFKPVPLFHATDDEKTECAEVMQRGTFNLVWALAGSSLHKFSPHMDAVIARVMLEMPESRVFLVGDDACKLLEQGWDGEKRVVRLSGKLPIRKTLALAMAADLVIGPETGVLNAVGMERKPHKVLMLSHSSENNLSKHWVNTQSLTPKHCGCYPCHMLHYTNEFCDIDEKTGAARCAVNIDAGMIYTAVEKVYKTWQRGKL